MHNAPLAAVAAAVMLGVAGQVVASLTRLPAIVFLLLLGAAAGPHGLGLVRPDDLGAGLPVLVSAFVAIILFEGALTLRPELIRQALAPVRRLITVGAAVTLAGAAALAHFVGGLPWPLAFLFASLVIVTGPTVIAPILRRVPLAPRLHAVLKSESILIDPVGVFAAVAVFQFVVGLGTEGAGWSGTLLGFLARVGAGTLVGLLAGGTAALASRLPLLHRPDNEHLVHLGALGLALAAFAAAERLQPEAGVMAVVVAGLILARLPIPFRSELEKFKEQVTTLGVSVLFILLAADLELPLLLRARWRDVALLLGLILLVRPAAVFLSTAGTGLSWREKAYLGLMAPRGILAAAMAGYFAGQFREHGLAGADRIEMLVFCTIFATVCLQGAWASLLARLLGVRPGRPGGALLVGVNEWSLALARQLRACGQPVLFIDNNPAQCELARGQGFTVHQGDATSRETYARLDLSVVGVLVAMTPNDAVNTLACDAAGSWLRDRGLLQVVSKPAGLALGPAVRMGGRWAMPTSHSHREVALLLRQRRLVLASACCRRATTITPALRTCHGGVVPLLILDRGNLSIAVAGQTCPPNAVIIGLIPAEVRSGTAAASPPPAGGGAGRRLPPPGQVNPSVSPRRPAAVRLPAPVSQVPAARCPSRPQAV